MDSIAGRFESELSLPALVVSMAGRFESEPSPASPGGISIARRFESEPLPASPGGISIAGRFESGLSLPTLVVSMAGPDDLYKR